MNQRGQNEKPIEVGLFVTCLVDLFRPSVGFATVALLEHAGCRVHVPERQTCCGQPAYNSGDRADAGAIARQVIDSFSVYDYVVAPSASCAAMIAKHYPALLEDDDGYRDRARAVAAKTFELTHFLTDVLGVVPDAAEFRGAVVYQDSCSALRELGIRDQPRRLLHEVAGVELRELRDPEACCGFGGLFCVKYSEISAEMVNRKADDVMAAGADVLTGVDLGCLLNTAGRLKRRGCRPEVRHIAEILAPALECPGIGDGRTG